MELQLGTFESSYNPFHKGGSAQGNTPRFPVQNPDTIAAADEGNRCSENSACIQV